LNAPRHKKGRRTPPLWLRGLLLSILLVLFITQWLRLFSALPLAGFALSKYAGTAPSDAAPLFQTRFASHGQTEFVHSPAVVELSGGRLRAFWYGGAAEGAKDAAIYSAVYDPGRERWSQEVPLILKEETEKGLKRYVKTLGNPVVLKMGPDFLWLFYVSVSMGGWSGSAINLTTSKDEGKTWTPPRRLIASPFFNLSTLVKGRPFLFKDGTIGLPVYHEFIGKFGELLRLDRKGHVIHKNRLSWGRFSLQPVIIPTAGERAICLMRYCGSSLPRILSLNTKDGGIRWSCPKKTDLPNPNSAIAALRVDGGGLLLVFNNSEHKRDDLSLAHSSDHGNTWRVIYTFEKKTAMTEEDDRQFSYPYLIRDSSGVFHLLYSANKTHIKHVQFNFPWVEQKL
jgi:predicted neuraminidase